MLTKFSSVATSTWNTANFTPGSSGTTWVQRIACLLPTSKAPTPRSYSDTFVQGPKPNAISNMLATLRRLSIGPIDPAPPAQALRVDRAVPYPEDGTGPSPEALREGLVPLDRMPLDPPDVPLAHAGEALRFTQGQAIAAASEWPPGLVCARSEDGTLLGVGEVDAGALRPRVVVPRD